MIASELEAGASDWEARALCPDDSCIGVLDAQGRCSTCGRQGEAPAARPPSAADVEASDSDAADVTAGAASSSSGEAGPESGEFDDRELCPDESCIGVLDDAGACKVCGKRQA